MTVSSSWLPKLEAMTVRSKDNGQRFTDTTRLDYIKGAMSGSAYTLAGTPPLALIYWHREFDPTQPAILFSSHIDEVYPSLFVADRGDGVLHGTFDNSAPSAVLLDLLLSDELPPQVVVAFTGDEEEDSRGASQVVDWWADSLPAPGHPAAVVVLDVTGEGYPAHFYTLENLFLGQPDRRLPGLADLPALADRLTAATGASDEQVFIEAECDEAWRYDEFGLTCCSVCLPTDVLGDDMHAAAGLALRAAALPAYRSALQRVAAGLTAV